MSVIAIKTADLTQNFKQIADMVVNGEQVLISRPKNENLVVITQKEYNALDKMRQNLFHNTADSVISENIEVLRELAK